MQKGDTQVNLFALAGTSMEKEVAKETTSDDATTREIITQEDISLAKFGTMKYLVVHCKDATYDYYAYMGLIEDTDGMVLKFFDVRTDSDGDVRELFKEFAENQITKKELVEEASEAESETSMA